MLDPTYDKARSALLMIIVTFSMPVALPVVVVAATTVALVVVAAHDDFRGHQRRAAEVPKHAHGVAFFEVSKRQGMVAVHDRHAGGHADRHPIDHHRAWWGDAVDRASYLRLVAVGSR